MDRKRQVLLVLFLSVIATFIFLYPVILHLGTHIPGFYSTDEPFGVIWSFWWLKFAYLNKIPVSPIGMLACPLGIEVISLSFFPLWGLIAKYIAIFFNEIVAYNSILVSTFILSSLTMYFLMCYLTKNIGISIFVALVYSFSPFHSVRGWQHLGTAQIQWMPLYILFLFMLQQKKKIMFVFLLGLTLALNFYFDVHYAYYMAIVSCLFFLSVLLAKTNRKDALQFTMRILLAGLIGVALIFPALWPFWAEFMKTSNQVPSAYSLVRPFEDLFSQSAKPLSYFLPFTEHPVFGKITKMFIGSHLWGESLTEHNVFLGFIPMFLATVAFIRRKAILSLMKSRGADASFALRFFLLLIFVAWLFSQSPWWSIFGLKLYMPSFFMYKILPMFRASVRFGIVVMLGVSVLAGFGIIYILNKFKSQKIKITFMCIVCFFSLYEFWYNPNEHTIDLSTYPKVYDWLKEQKSDFTIVEYPLDVNGPNEMYKFYQTKHQKKIINGTLPGTYANRIARTITELSSLKTASVLKWMGVKYALVHRDEYRKSGLIRDEQEIEKIHNNIGLKLIDVLDDIEIYEIVAESLQPRIE